MHRMMILFPVFTFACSTTPDIDVQRTVQQLETSLAPEEVQHEAPAWKQYGIIASTTAPPPSGITHRILLLDATHKTVGTIDITDQPSEPEFTRKLVTTIANRTLVIETGDTGSLRLTDPVTERQGTTRFSIEKENFDESTILQEIDSDFPGFIPITFGSLSALDSEALKKSLLIEPADNKTSHALSLGCYGSWFRGGAWWGQQSGCCALAQSDVARLCTNQWCLGCCAHLACDVWCARGNYACVCGMSGRACSVN